MRIRASGGVHVVGIRAVGLSARAVRAGTMRICARGVDHVVGFRAVGLNTRPMMAKYPPARGGKVSFDFHRLRISGGHGGEDCPNDANQQKGG